MSSINSTNIITEVLLIGYGRSWLISPYYIGQPEFNLHTSVLLLWHTANILLRKPWERRGEKKKESQLLNCF